MHFSSDILHCPSGRSSGRPSGGASARLISFAIALSALTWTSQAAEWRTGFEPAEGYAEGASAVGSTVSVVGGTALVHRGGAAEGEQFVRFTPQQEENALIVELGERVARKSGTRRIDFAARLAGSGEDTRLVLNHGQTIALRSHAGGVDVEIPGEESRRLFLAPSATGWITIGIEEHVEERTWNLYLNGIMAASALPLQSSSELFSELLVFADGVLDLDTVQASVSAATQTRAGGTETETTPERASSGGAGQAALVSRGHSIARALESARRDDFAAALSIASAIPRPSKTPGEEDLESAQLLALMAFALRDEGRYRAATVLGHQALQGLVETRVRALAEGLPAKRRAAYEIVAAQIAERILIDEAQAERLFKKAAELDPSHAGAKENHERLRRKREARSEDVAGRIGGGE